MAATLIRTAGVLSSVLLVASFQIATARAQRSDPDLRDHIAYSIETTPALKKYDITVKVDHRTVTLAGTVATPGQRAEAGRLAHVDGVDHVDNLLVVDRSADQTLAERARRGLRRTGEALDDVWITTKVKWFFSGEALLAGSDVKVETDHRVVNLSGTVRSEDGRRRAVGLARDTDGVTDVVDHLVIR